MKYRLIDMLDNVDDNDLYKIKADLSKGGFHLKKVVDAKLKQIEKQKAVNCTVCGQPLAEKEKTYTLLFGREDFKKKASFCEIDCLEYFLSQLKQQAAPKVKD